MSAPRPMVGGSPSGQWGFSRGFIVRHPLIWKISAGAVGGVWLASVIVTGLTLGSGEAWSLLLMNVATSATAVLFLWSRTTHPDDAWAKGDAAGYARAYVEMDRHPRSGGIRLVK